MGSGFRATYSVENAGLLHVQHLGFDKIHFGYCSIFFTHTLRLVLRSPSDGVAWIFLLQIFSYHHMPRRDQRER